MGASHELLHDVRLFAEAERCLNCPDKPCEQGCPAHCSPADFLAAVRGGRAEDFTRAAMLILASNPLGGVCGLVCPDTHCMAECTRGRLDEAIRIPAAQATIVRRARELGASPDFDHAPTSESRVAVVGGGPAGLAAAAVLSQHGHSVTIFDPGRGGGMARSIPDFRLAREMLEEDLQFILGLGEISFEPRWISEPRALLDNGFDAVVVATGRHRPMTLGVDGEVNAVVGLRWLADPESESFEARKVAVVGGGAVAADCALTASRQGASWVEMIALESLPELPLTSVERESLLAANVHVSGRTRVTAVHRTADGIAGLDVIRVELPTGASFHPTRVVDVAGSEHSRADIDAVVVAIGSVPDEPVDAENGIFVAGDLVTGPSTVVEAVASGKEAAGQANEFLGGEKTGESRGCWTILSGRRMEPVSLECDFFGRPIRSPLLLSAAPPTDGYRPMRRAYEAGWSGGVLKTAFDGGSIHVPAEYMVKFNPDTWGNCDNVSAHPLDRVCREVEQLCREFPDRLTLASTGGPVSGHDEEDAAVWVRNTRKLEACGVHGIEFSLSCPQGGDGTKGDIVSQDPEATAKVIEWVLSATDPSVPKLFKLTAAVTAIQPVAAATRKVLDRNPDHLAGITLANTFPTLAFRDRSERRWHEGIVVGMSGAGVFPITALSIAKAAPFGVPISANGGVMNALEAAHLMALGATSVQVCTVVLRDGVEVVDHLHTGLSHLLESQGIDSVAELVGRALPEPITEFDDLTAVKGISAVRSELCIQCGRCGRCPYLAIAFDDDAMPVTDPEHCIGCSLCVQQCPSGALHIRPRTEAEAAALEEA